ncbi:hypothetical protein H5410_030900, partial [Solanum commersonii]
MKRRMDNIEKRCEIFESAIFRDPSSPPSSSEQNTTEHTMLPLLNTIISINCNTRDNLLWIYVAHVK